MSAQGEKDTENTGREEVDQHHATEENPEPGVFYDPEIASDFFLTDLGQPLFSKARIREARDALRRISPEGGEFELHDVNGQKKSYNHRLTRHSGPEWGELRLGLTYTPFVNCPRALIKEALAKFPHRTLPVSIATIGESPHNCEDFQDLEMDLDGWETEWESSVSCQKTKDFLRQHARELEEVDRVMCFGLGQFTLPDKKLQRSYTQHLAALTIRNVLNELRQARGIPEKVTISAQEPAYCEVCKKVVRGRLGIEILDDPDGFLMIDQNSFVVSIAPNVSVNQITVDVTADVGGPAALLCFKVRPLDEDPKALRLSTDPVSPRLVDYVSKCATMDYGEEILPGEKTALERTSLYIKQTSRDQT